MMKKNDLVVLQNSITTVPSGGEVRLYNLLLRLRNDFSLVLFGYFSNAEMNSILQITPYIRYKYYDFLSIYLSYILRSIDLAIRIVKFRWVPCTIYSSSDFFPDTIPSFLCKSKKNRWVQSIFHFYLKPSEREGNYFKNFLAYYAQKFSFFLIKKKSDRIIVINDLVKDNLVKLGFLEEKIFVSSCGINIDYFDNLSKLDYGYDTVCISRLNPTKGIFDLIEIWKRVCEQRNSSRLAIIGDGRKEIYAKMKHLIKKYDLQNNVDILGYLPNDNAYQVVKSSKLFVFPSHEEGWGISIAEAMACKIPVVCWDLELYDTIFADRVDKIEKYNYDAFAEKVLLYLYSDLLCKAQGEENYRFIKKYSWDKVAEREKQILQS
jgi:glycosyltransferase involved in cell wall biosynthesis